MSIFITNYSVTSKASAWYEFKRKAELSTLLNYNWQVISSSTGSGGVYAQSGDVITSASSLGTLAWFVLESKGIVDSGVLYRRRLCFQFNASGNVRITYSPRDGFITGSPSTTQVPTATDGRILWGGGTDAAPTFTELLPSGGVWMQGYFDEGSDNFYIVCYPVGGGAPTAFFYCDCLPLAYTTTGALVDPDPTVLYAGTGANCGLVTDLASEERGSMGFLSLLVPTSILWCRLAASYRAVYDASDTSRVMVPTGLPTAPTPYLTSPTYAQDVFRYGRRTLLANSTQSGNFGNANTVGDKGTGTLLRWSGYNFTVPALVNLVDSSGFASGTALGIGHVFLPWTTTAPSL